MQPRRGRVGQTITACLVAALCHAVAFGSARAQASGDTLARAAALRDAKDFAGAVALLEGWTRDHSADAGSIWMLAQTLYWMHRNDDAIASYDRALALEPDDRALRLDYGRVLVELRRHRTALAVLEPLRQRDDGWAVEADYLVGLSDYWRGDLSAAADAFDDVLARAPEHVEATRLRSEIRAATASWLHLQPSGRHDTQTLDRAGFDGELGFFLSPMQWIALEGSLARLSWTDSTSTVVSGLIATRAQVGPALAIEAAVGAARWSAADSMSLVGRASIELRPASRFTLTAEAERAPYTSTTASIMAPLAPDRLEMRVAIDRVHLTGEAAVRLERFPDDNQVRTAYAWLLTPLVRGARGDLKVGYAVAWQDADESRAMGVVDGIDPVTGLRGFAVRYAPYHTPVNLVAHSVAGAASIALSPVVSLSANGSWAFSAHDDAPFFFAADTLSGSPPGGGSYRRTFHPLEVRASLSAALSARVNGYVEAAHSRTVFYEATRAHIGMLIHFPGRTP